MKLVAGKRIQSGMRMRAWIIAVLLVAALLAWEWRARGPVIAASTLPAAQVDDALAPPGSPARSIVLAGGCFWGVQGVYQHVRGVTDAIAGYAGGVADTAQYETVSSGNTGHAESVKVIYDPSQISLGRILQIFFSVVHIPTELNYQGPDTGTQYRSAIFYSSQQQWRIAHAYIDQLRAAKVFSRPIVTMLTPLTADRSFYRAEEYHQDFLQHNPGDLYIRINDLPKIAALKSDWPQFYRASATTAASAAATAPLRK